MHLSLTITRNTTVLTPNRRLSAWLTQIYNKQQSNREKSAWESADILPFNSWILRLWDEYSYSTCELLPTLLTTTQEAYLWEMIVSQSELSQQLLQVSETANTAHSAWQLLNEWNVNTNHPLFDTMDDGKAFKKWSTEFAGICKKNNWLDNSSLLAHILDLLMAKKIKTAEEIIFYGFTEFSPSMQKLIDNLKENKIKVSIHKNGSIQSDSSQCAFETTDQELIAAARFSKKLSDHAPEATIGIVIPHLDSTRNRIKQLLEDVFKQPDKFNITAGSPLAHYPVIKTALCLLDMKKLQIPQQAFSYLLASPFLGGAEKEYIRRANLDSRIRQDNLDIVNLDDLNNDTSTLAESFHKATPKLFKLLKQWLFDLTNCEGKKTYADWAHAFSKLLHTLGWPGDRSLNSDEYQVVEKWQGLLAEFSRLDQIASPTYYHSALEALHKLLGKQSFQPKTPDANVQIMGILEAASVPFDYLWVTGMDDTAWPPQPHPNPFIPLRIQRDFNMPHATSQRELDYCNLITAQFRESARSVIFSYAKTMDELEVSASPLIKSFPYHDQLDLAEYVPASQSLLGTATLEVIHDVAAPAIHADETISGGVSVIKDQALCPFKSFATWRLHARKLEEPLPGLRKKDRGTITHQILETIWASLQDQKTLLSLTGYEIEKLVEETINDVSSTSKYMQQQRPEFLKLEKSRLNRLIMEWLEVEKSRPSFSIHTQEAETHVNLGHLTLKGRIDRIDKLANNELLIIDYKTSSKLDINNWFGDRPEEPQLPIYALHNTEACGIAFGQVYTGRCSFDGLSRQDTGISGITPIEKSRRKSEPDWAAQTSQWESTLTSIANQFHSGQAMVDPKNGIETCQLCSLQPLCRIHQEPEVEYDE